jgi:beta-galactosidase GanA
MDNKKSFNLYVIHGGTNFGFTAGANSGGKGYEPDVTSYDYDAPINEQGNPAPKYFALRKLLGCYLPKDKKLPPIPDPVPAIEIPAVKMEALTSVLQNLLQPKNSVQPKPMEAYGQDYGFILYRTRLIGHKRGRLTVTDIHDYAIVFLNGKYIGKLDRREGLNTITLPESNAANPVLDILVEAMGRINFAQYLIDRKGITDRVTLNGMTLMNWDVYNLPMEEKYIASLKNTGPINSEPAVFFKGIFKLEKTGDTFIDFTNYQKGVIWINGHNLGRYWNIGPQKRLYCPASWLKTGENEIIVFDLHQTEAKEVSAYRVME